METNSSSLDFLSGDAVDVAQRLLGCLLVRELDGKQIVVRIVEVESYDQTDTASHSYRGKTPRTEVMFGASGRAYVYFTYGMHYCLNVVCGQPGEGAAVLIRAVEPVSGAAYMRTNRPHVPELTNGPAKLCQAMRIDRQFNGHDLSRSPLQLYAQPPVAKADIVQTTRVGIRRDTERLWRFYLKQNPFVSKR